jgi:hypothetical protein
MEYLIIRVKIFHKTMKIAIINSISSQWLKISNLGLDSKKNFGKRKKILQEHRCQELDS